ncbi:RsmB/NOP family class I SAM-dependent RNA methyltransferase [Aurantiacibacter poecillastricola]|uniref:RsmB/NOP family class I SAM-dependent RNA methyltransferase n=1 Tax=Aurantiacibacter poecillastricola TaxID=3064385 RepID=UPI00273D467C|nr:RsmB/NOP family class I SAM-dependent RNA methyltransferase [Aurantiacibacter sp. 219JJ12-13]MDP5261845.1 RsmB/NOP family class I SAM-dependent RNA methyltransferase [Aurantiacibacter sp. 219JJ12-13]
MTPAARVQAAIEILDQVIEAARTGGAPADRLVADWFKNHRFAGSKDKRAIREHVYDAIRACGPVPTTGRAAMLGLAEEQPGLRDLFTGEGYGPAPVEAGEQPAEGGVAPEWLEDRLIASGIVQEEAEALLARAPLDVRINGLKCGDAVPDLPERGEDTVLPGALRFPSGTQVTGWEAYTNGLVEIQDLGSQIACLAVGARPGETVVDLCAGAGGKTLALAAAMANDGTLVAADTDRRRLSELAPRAERAGAPIAAEVLLDPGREAEALAAWLGRADRVLVDAPCSGTGTWRRNPEARWRLTPAALERLVTLQAHVLDVASKLVRPGGSLTYVTCSLLDEEGAGQLERFLAANPDWSVDTPTLPLGTTRGAGIRLSPSRDGTDGFFIARIAKAW